MVQEAIQGLVEPVVRMWRRLMGGQELPSQPSGDEYPANLVTLLTQTGVPAEPIRHVREVLIRGADLLQDVVSRGEGKRKTEVEATRLLSILKQFQQWRYRTIPVPTEIFGEYGWAAVEGYFQVFEEAVPFVKGKIPSDGGVAMSVSKAASAHREIVRGIKALTLAVRELEPEAAPSDEGNKSRQEEPAGQAE